MVVVINGSETTLDDGVSVSDLVGILDLKGRIAVEINQEIVPRSQFPCQILQDGDSVEIVHAIGGG